MSLINDILHDVERNYEIRKRLVPDARHAVFNRGGSGATGLMELVALVEQYFAAKDEYLAYCQGRIGLCEPGHRVREAEAALRAAVAP